MVGRDHGHARPRQLDVPHFDVSLVVNVIEVEHREDARVRPPPLQVRIQVDAQQAVRQELGAAGAEVISQELSPRVVAELEARLRDSEAGGKPASA